MCINKRVMVLGGKQMLVSCGYCIECKISKSIEWSYRIVDECKSYENSCFITLTYNNENLPEGSTLDYRDVQLFLKRLRKKLSPFKIRYFCCGEYGEKFKRPHYHIIIFGWKPADLRYYKNDGCGCNLYLSKTISDLWQKGYILVGDELNQKTALYCSKYLQKSAREMKEDGDKRQPPFVHMSTHPGIGYYVINDRMLLSGKHYLNGKSIPLPRYYKKVLEKRELNGDPVLICQFHEKIRNGFISDFLINALYDRSNQFYEHLELFKNKTQSRIDSLHKKFDVLVNCDNLLENLDRVCEALTYNFETLDYENRPPLSEFNYMSRGSFTFMCDLQKQKGEIKYTDYDNKRHRIRTKYDFKNSIDCFGCCYDDNVNYIKVYTKGQVEIYYDTTVPDFEPQPVQLRI